MSERVVSEVVRRMWIEQSSEKPFSQLNGSHKVTDAGLSMYFARTEYDEDRNSTFHMLDICFIPTSRLQGLLQYIQETGLASSQNAALEFLLQRIRDSHSKLRNRRVPLFIILLVVLTVVVANMLLSASQFTQFSPPLPAYVHAVLIVLPLLILIYLLLWGYEARITRACRELPLDDARAYHQALCNLTPQIDLIATNHLAGINWLLVTLMTLWLIGAVALVFIP